MPEKDKRRQLLPTEFVQISSRKYIYEPCICSAVTSIISAACPRPLLPLMREWKCSNILTGMWKREATKSVDNLIEKVSRTHVFYSDKRRNVIRIYPYTRYNSRHVGSSEEAYHSMFKLFRYSIYEQFKFSACVISEVPAAVLLGQVNSPWVFKRRFVNCVMPYFDIASLFSGLAKKRNIVDVKRN